MSGEIIEAVLMLRCVRAGEDVDALPTRIKGALNNCVSRGDKESPALDDEPHTISPLYTRRTFENLIDSYTEKYRDGADGCAADSKGNRYFIPAVPVKPPKLLVDNEYCIRVTLYGADGRFNGIFAGYDGSILIGETIHLGPANSRSGTALVVENVERFAWMDASEFVNRVKMHSENEEWSSTSRRLALLFLTPTTFSEGEGGNVDFPLPEPVRFFGGLARKFRAFWESSGALVSESFFGVDPASEDFVRKAQTLAARLRMPFYRLQTNKWDRKYLKGHGEHKSQIGFQGDVIYDMSGFEPGSADLRLMTTLGIFGEYCGAGVYAAYGMGQTRCFFHEHGHPEFLSLLLTEMMMKDLPKLSIGDKKGERKKNSGSSLENRDEGNFDSPLSKLKAPDAQLDEKKIVFVFHTPAGRNGDDLMNDLPTPEEILKQAAWRMFQTSGESSLWIKGLGGRFRTIKELQRYLETQIAPRILLSQHKLYRAPDVTAMGRAFAGYVVFDASKLPAGRHDAQLVRSLANYNNSIII